MSLNLLWRVLEETRFDDPVEKLLLVQLCDASTPEGEVIFHPARLAARCCTTPRDLGARLLELEARGWIRHDETRAAQMLSWLRRDPSVYAFWLLDAARIEAQLPLGDSSLGDDACESRAPVNLALFSLTDENADDPGQGRRNLR